MNNSTKDLIVPQITKADVPKAPPTKPKMKAPSPFHITADELQLIQRNKDALLGIYHEQPQIKGGGAGQPSWVAGKKKSIDRLRNLMYDPIGELVCTHRRLEIELMRQEMLRENLIEDVTPTGKPRYYSYQHHYALYDRLIKISESLLRYGYGRVPENNVIEEKKPAPLIVNLNRKGTVYVANEESLREMQNGED
jgi:hypothetical protein